MNRRQFLKSLLLTGAIVATSDIDTILEKTNLLSDKDFILYVTYQMRLMIDNPSLSKIITNIEIPDGY